SRAASTVSASVEGGCRYIVTGSDTAKNMRSVLMPAAKSIDAQATSPNSGFECSGPSFVLPYREAAREMTKTSTARTRRTENHANQAEVHPATGTSIPSELDGGLR